MFLIKQLTIKYKMLTIITFINKFYKMKMIIPKIKMIMKKNLNLIQKMKSAKKHYTVSICTLKKNNIRNI